MKPERWNQIESIFHKALEADEGRRGAVIEESCAGDEELRREVESLLAHHSDSASFIERPAFAGQVTTSSDRPVTTAVAPRPDLKGVAVGHYRMIEEIGSGGMGVVYKAEDTRLGRLVALKFLPEHMAADSVALERFRHEARSASSLNHPNICTIYDVAVYEGREFIVMEHLSGQTLAMYIAGRRAVGTELVAKLGMPIAEALGAAHSNGIIHRDIKPGNIFVTQSGLVKVLDFGVAKLVAGPSQSDAATLTETNTVAGTLPYMSPEQLRGENLDARSDIYALGVVLYEIATGQRLYSSSLQARLVDEILNRPASPPSNVNRKLSPKADDIILKCLAKDPEDRYQTAKEIAVDLRHLSTQAISGTVSAGTNSVRIGRRVWRWLLAAAAALTATLLPFTFNIGGLRGEIFARSRTGPIQSLAVLPLVNLSGDPSQDYYADGMTDELITALARNRSLRVVSRTSAMQYKGVNRPLRDIAQALGVNGILEGSVSRSADHVHVNLQLIYAPTDTHVWAESYDRDLSSAMSLPEELSQTIAGVARTPFTPIQPRRNLNPAAHDAYLMGHYLWMNGNNKGSRKYFEDAIHLQPDYAAAWSGVADSFIQSGDGGVPNRDLVEQAEAAARKALELDDSSPEAHHTMEFVYLFGKWDWNRADAESHRALELDPNSSEDHHVHSYVLLALNRPQEALQEQKRATEIDPFLRPWALGRLYIRLRQYDAAIEELRMRAQADSSAPWVHYYLARAYEFKGMDKELAQEIEQNARVTLGEKAAAEVHQAYERGGKKAVLQLQLNDLQIRQRGHYVSPWDLAVAYAALGMKGATLKSLDEAYREHSMNLIFLQWEPAFDFLHGEPRYRELVKNMGMPTAY